MKCSKFDALIMIMNAGNLHQTADHDHPHPELLCLLKASYHFNNCDTFRRPALYQIHAIASQTYLTHTFRRLMRKCGNTSENVQG